VKVFCAGASFYGGQADRIADGFRQLGHEVTPFPSEAALLYANDPPHYDQILADRAAGRLHGNVIFNVQDIPEHLFPNFDVGKLRHSLMGADAVTAISRYTRDQVSRYCALEPAVVYQPIKPVQRDPAMKVTCPYRFASVGRRSDENKRVRLWAHALQILGVSAREVALAGSEPGWGDYLGVQSDENLNRLYNSVDFVLASSRVEGLNLPVLEAMAAGAIPVVCRDMTTRTELLPSDIFPEYETVEPTPPSVASFIARYLNGAEAMAEMKDRLHAHYLAHWREKTSGAGVADRILHVYKGL